jgi:hypothetical protein
VRVAFPRNVVRPGNDELIGFAGTTGAFGNDATDAVASRATSTTANRATSATIATSHTGRGPGRGRVEAGGIR